MRKFLLGLACGLVVGVVCVAGVQAYANSYMMGWDVVRGGRVICQDPFMWTSTREIECD